MHRLIAYLMLSSAYLLFNAPGYANTIYIYGAHAGSHVHPTTHQATYILYLGSFASKENAERLKNTMQARIHRPIHLDEHPSQRSPYHVYIGPLHSAEEVREVSQHLLMEKTPSQKGLPTPETTAGNEIINDVCVQDGDDDLACFGHTVQAQLNQFVQTLRHNHPARKKNQHLPS